jgi:hypothetical protein
MSPYPTHKKVIAVNHIEFSKLACSSSWNLYRIKFQFFGFFASFQDKHFQARGNGCENLFLVIFFEIKFFYRLKYFVMVKM